MEGRAASRAREGTRVAQKHRRGLRGRVSGTTPGGRLVFPAKEQRLFIIEIRRCNSSVCVECGGVAELKGVSLQILKAF